MEGSVMVQVMSTGTVAKHLGVSTSLLRHLEKIGAIPAAQRIAGLDRRIYSPAEVEELRRIIANRRARTAQPLSEAA